MATKSLKGTRTERNIAEAYISETQANARYIYYAKQAGKDNYFPIQAIFEETAENELHHAKVFLKMLQGGQVEATLAIPAIPVADTATNLAEAIREETEEGVDAYVEAARVADEEGFPEIAEHFRAIAEVEKHHRERFKRYLRRVKAGTVWKRSKSIKWQCLVCGYIFEGKEPPTTCPGCDHPYQHYTALDGIND